MRNVAAAWLEPAHAPRRCPASERSRLVLEWSANEREDLPRLLHSVPTSDQLLEQESQDANRLETKRSWKRSCRSKKQAGYPSHSGRPAAARDPRADTTDFEVEGKRPEHGRPGRTRGDGVPLRSRERDAATSPEAAECSGDGRCRYTAKVSESSPHVRTEPRDHDQDAGRGPIQVVDFLTHPCRATTDFTAGAHTRSPRSAGSAGW